MDGHPLFAFLSKRVAAFFAESIILPLAAGVGFAPFGFDQLLLFHPVQDGIEHAFGPFDSARRKFRGRVE